MYPEDHEDLGAEAIANHAYENKFEAFMFGYNQALKELVSSLAGGLAAFAGGAAITRFGYPPVLIASGCLAMAAALLFRMLVREPA